MAKNSRPGGMDNLDMGPKTGFTDKTPLSSGGNNMGTVAKVAGGQIECCLPAGKAPSLPGAGK